VTPTALTIAGSDSGGGAGIQADLKTFSALGVYGASAVTAVTAQNTRSVSAVFEIPGRIVAAQIDAVLEDIAVHAVKVGMLFTAEVARAVAARLRERSLPIVLDPVMVAKSGDSLLREDAAAALTEEMLPLATLLTPNLPEAARILGAAQAADEAEMVSQARRLLRLGAGAVLMKGGHGAGSTVTDILVVGEAEPVRLEAPRRSTRNTHGTGCSLSSAVAAELARGRPLEESVRAAHAWLQAAIQAADALEVGSGHGPVHHFHEFWRRNA
jgi:hydroxymethylpyrimidine/phosphomethylpyrimidine kinase